MKRNEIQTRDLDALATRMLKAGRLDGDEIDKIVSAPKLFDAVRARIAVSDTKPISRSIWFAWKPSVATLAAIAILMISFGYIGYFNGTETAATARSRKLPAIFKVDEDTAKQDFRPPVTVSASSEVTRPTITKAVYREEIKPVRPKAKRASIEREGEFYALNFAGNMEDAMRGGHVVRVDMSRSSLFALGVNVPLENDAKFVKTDLLVGTDGVPRAIRFVE